MMYDKDVIRATIITVKSKNNQKPKLVVHKSIFYGEMIFDLQYMYIVQRLEISRATVDPSSHWVILAIFSRLRGHTMR